MEFNKAREGERMNLQTHRLLLTWFVFIRIKTVACAYFTNVDSKMEYNILHQGALKDSFFPRKIFSWTNSSFKLLHVVSSSHKEGNHCSVSSAVKGNMGIQ